MRSLSTALFLVGIPLVAGAQPALQSISVAPPATLIHAGKAAALSARASIASGDLLRTGPRGSAGLQMAGDSVVTLGDSSELFVHSMGPPSQGRGPLLRLQLLRGDIVLEAYPPAKALPHDYRINLGPLRVRALGADLWAYANAKSEGVCLHQGAIEITGAAGVQRLDVAGDCVQHDSVRGTLELLSQAETQLKDDLLNFAPIGSEAATPVSPALAAAPASAPSAAQPTAVARWTVVLASLPDLHSAEQAARLFERQGLSVRIVEVSRPHAFRLISGDYGQRLQASRAAVRLRKQHRLEHAWVAATP